MLMAAAAAELTGRPGACVVTRGPGAASAVNGVAHALLDRQPLLLVSDCVPAASRDRIAHQRLDHAALFGPVTKASFVLGSTSTAADVRAAVALSLAGPPGPVHLDLDPTAPGTPIAAGTRTALAPRPTSARSAPRCGPRAGRSSSPASARRRPGLRRLVAGSTVPVLTTYKAKGVVPETGPNAAGIATGATIEAPLLLEADLVVGVGLDPVELIPAPWPYAAPVVLLGTWPTVDDGAYFGDHLRRGRRAGPRCGARRPGARAALGLARTARRRTPGAPRSTASWPPRARRSRAACSRRRS